MLISNVNFIILLFTIHCVSFECFKDTEVLIQFQYMQDNKHIDVEDMTEYLIATYPEFRRKNKKAFMRSVEKGECNCYFFFLGEFLSSSSWQG